jgi:hypothetical protein
MGGSGRAPAAPSMAPVPMTAPRAPLGLPASGPAPPATGGRGAQGPGNKRQRVEARAPVVPPDHEVLPTDESYDLAALQQRFQALKEEVCLPGGATSQGAAAACSRQWGTLLGCALAICAPLPPCNTAPCP